MIVRRFKASNGETVEVRKVQEFARNVTGILAGTENVKAFARGLTTGIEVEVDPGEIYRAPVLFEAAIV